MSSSESQSMPLTMGNFTSFYGVVSATEINAAIDRVKKFTLEIFDRPCRIVLEEDPEIVDYRLFVVYVKDDGEVDELIARSSRWHHCVADLPVNVRLLFVLSFDD